MNRSTPVAYLLEKALLALASLAIGALAAWTAVAGAVAVLQRDHVLPSQPTATAPGAAMVAPPAAAPPTAAPAPMSAPELAALVPDAASQALRPACQPDEIQQLDSSAADMRSAKSIHQQWITYLEQHGPVANVGDPTWHQMWVDKYAQVLQALQAYRDACVAGGLPAGQ